MSYSSILETYSITQILEYNDLTEEDCLEFLVEEGYIKLNKLPLQPLEFDD